MGVNCTQATKVGDPFFPPPALILEWKVSNRAPSTHCPGSITMDVSGSIRPKPKRLN
jgi:hypothetical protein